MKKILCLLISMIVLLTVGSAFAEAFTLHSGVQFGMTMDEVIRKENNAGFTGTIKKELDVSSKYNCPEDHNIVCVKVYGQIAGVNTSSITYHFRNDGGLDSAVYSLGIGSDINVYENIRKSLIKKYGEPDKEMSAVWHAFLDMDIYSASDYFIDNPIIPGTSMKISNIKYSYDESWLIPQDDGGYVIITGCHYSEYNTGGSIKPYTSLSTMVGYQYFSKEEIENAVFKAVEAIDKYNKQVEDDL